MLPSSNLCRPGPRVVVVLVGCGNLKSAAFTRLMNSSNGAILQDKSTSKGQKGEGKKKVCFSSNMRVILAQGPC